MFKCFGLTAAAILYAEFAFACSLGISPIRGFDPAHYIFIGEIVEVLDDVPYTSGGFDDSAVGFRVRVTQLIHPSRKTKDRLYFDVVPLRLAASCNLMSDRKELLARFSVGAEVRVIAKTPTVVMDRSPAGPPLRLETSIYNGGSFSRNDLRNGLRTSATRIYDYRTWASHPARTATDHALVESSYGLLEFELQKDLLRLKTAVEESAKLSILERLAFYPHLRALDLPALARSVVKEEQRMAALEERWTQRTKEFDDSVRPPPPRPDPPLRNPELRGLLTHLKGPSPEAAETIRRLVAYLDGRPERDDPLAALLAWLQAGFPELRDKNGIWNIAPHLLAWDFASSLGYFLQRLPATLRTARYLDVLEAVKADDHVATLLAQRAARYLPSEELKESGVTMLRSTDVSKRRYGALMVCRLSETDVVVWQRCREALVSDDDSHVRLTVLHSMPSYQDLSASRREELVGLTVQVFLTDASDDVREAAARHVAAYADLASVLDFPETSGVLARILTSLAETGDASIQERLAGFAAKATTKRPYYASERIPSAALAPLLSAIQRERAAGPGAGPPIVQLWLDWWHRVMREHSTRVY